MKCGKLCAMGKTSQGIQCVGLDEVQYIPGFYIKLFSLTMAAKKGAKITWHGTNMTIANKEVKLLFENHLNTKTSILLGIELKSLDYEMAQVAMQEKKKDTLNLHWRLRHVSNDMVKAT